MANKHLCCELEREKGITPLSIVVLRLKFLSSAFVYTGLSVQTLISTRHDNKNDIGGVGKQVEEREEYNT